MLGHLRKSYGFGTQDLVVRLGTQQLPYEIAKDRTKSISKAGGNPTGKRIRMRGNISSVALSRSTALRLGFDGQMPDCSKQNGGNSATSGGTFTPGIGEGWDHYIEDGFWFDNIV